MTSLSSIDSVETLETRLSEPTPEAIDAAGKLEGDVLVLGAGGKMGPTLSRMVRRASDLAGVSRRVIAVSRFGDQQARQALESYGIETVAFDLLDVDRHDALPDCPNVLYMAGMKFGSTGQEARTWAMNCAVPAYVARRYRDSRIMAFSTGNVYGMVPIESGGSSEGDALHPVGEYAQSCLGRERMFEFASLEYQTPVALLRLNYACELRYGILVDLAQKVMDEKPIDLAMGYFNVIWQQDANAVAIAALLLADSPAVPINISGPELLSVRSVCEQFGERFGKAPVLVGEESGDALLSNSQFAHEQVAPPHHSADELIDAVAEWTLHGGLVLGKPTGFQSRDGSF